MKKITYTKTICNFNELSEEDKAKAIEKNRNFNTEDSFWSESVIDDGKAIAALMGIEIKNVYWSRFYSQGDGACFEGTFRHKKDTVKAVLNYAPQDKEIQRIAREVQDLHRKSFYRNSGKITHRGHYHNERSMEISCDDFQEEWTEIFADFARWIYRNLETEFEYQSSDKIVAESLIANEVEFTLNEAGELED
jgi:hypothetical protein